MHLNCVYQVDCVCVFVWFSYSAASVFVCALRRARSACICQLYVSVCVCAGIYYARLHSEQFRMDTTRPICSAAPERVTIAACSVQRKVARHIDYR